MEKCPEVPITCSNLSMLSLLLDKRGNYAPIDKIITKFTSFESPPDEVLEILLNRKLVDVNERLLEAMAGRYETLTLVLSQAPDLPISRQAAKDPRSMRLLLDKEVAMTQLQKTSSLVLQRQGNFNRSSKLLFIEPVQLPSQNTFSEHCSPMALLKDLSGSVSSGQI